MIDQKSKPTEIPIVINGFKKKGKTQPVKFKDSLKIDDNASNDEMMETIMTNIERSKPQQDAPATLYNQVRLSMNFIVFRPVSVVCIF